MPKLPEAGPWPALVCLLSIACGDPAATQDDPSGAGNDSSGTGGTTSVPEGGSLTTAGMQGLAGTLGLSGAAAPEPEMNDACAGGGCAVRWLRGIGASGIYDFYVGGADFDADGGAVIVGSAPPNSGVVDQVAFPTSSSKDAFMLGVDRTGAVVGAHLLGGSHDDGALDVALLPDEDRIVVGYANVRDFSAEGGSTDIEIQRVGPDGETRWNLQFGAEEVTCGNCYDERAAGVAVGDDGTIFVVGYATGSASLGDVTLNGGCFVLALSDEGEPVWATDVDGRLPSSHLILTPDAVFVAIDEVSAPGTPDEIIVSKLSRSDGEVEGVRRVLTPNLNLANFDTLGFALAPDGQGLLLVATEREYAGGYYMHGRTRVYRLGVDVMDMTESQELSISNPQEPRSAAPLPDGGWAIVGREYDYDKEVWQLWVSVWSEALVLMGERSLGSVDIDGARVRTSVEGEILAFGEVSSAGASRPHPVFTAGGTSVQARQLGFALQLLLVLLVQSLQQVQLFALFLEGVAVVFDVGDGALHVGFRARDERALKGAGQKGAAPVLGAAQAVAKHNVAGQVLVLRAEPVQQPRAHRGLHHASGAGVHHHGGKLV